MAKENLSYVNRAYTTIYAHKNNEEVEKVLKEDTPEYDPCDNTLSSPYDTKFKNEHSDKGVQYQGNFCLEKPKKIIVKDSPFNPPEECCCGCTIPTPEKPFKRPTGECNTVTHEMIPCDSRVETIVTGHYAYEEKDKEANTYFNSKQVVEGEEETTNYVVSQPNVNEESTANSVGSNDGTVVIEGKVTGITERVEGESEVGKSSPAEVPNPPLE